jgi:hypothetical protein
MNDVIKNWRKFVCENEDLEDKGPQSFPFRIFCDMDGVLVDLASGILEEAHQDATDPKQRAAVMKIIASDIPWRGHKGDEKMKKGLKFIYKLISDDQNFWASLPPIEDAMALWGFISQFEPFILSHPWDEASAKGKRMWLSSLAGNLSPPLPQSRIILTGDKHKFSINKATGAPNVLIDDMEKYIEPWRAADGIAIHHVSADSSIRELKQIMENYNG